MNLDHVRRRQAHQLGDCLEVRPIFTAVAHLDLDQTAGIFGLVVDSRRQQSAQLIGGSRCINAQCVVLDKQTGICRDGGQPWRRRTYCLSYCGGRGQDAPIDGRLDRIAKRGQHRGVAEQ